MNLSDITNGSAGFVDTNILLYARTGQSRQCQEFLRRCKDGKVTGMISELVVAEFCHRRMIQEFQSSGWAGSNPVRALSQNPDPVRKMSVYADDVRGLLGGELSWNPATQSDFFVALELQKQHGLMTNDSLILAVTRRLGLTEIATADSHFDPIAGLSVYKPDDLKI